MAKDPLTTPGVEPTPTRDNPFTRSLAGMASMAIANARLHAATLASLAAAEMANTTHFLTMVSDRARYFQANPIDYSPPPLAQTSEPSLIQQVAYVQESPSAYHSADGGCPDGADGAVWACATPVPRHRLAAAANSVNGSFI